MSDTITPRAAECAADALLAVVCGRVGDTKGGAVALGLAIKEARAMSPADCASFFGLLASLSETSGVPTLLEGAEKIRAQKLDGFATRMAKP